VTSWVAGAAGSAFDVDNLPLGIYSTGDAPRPGVAIGDFVADLSTLVRERLIDDETLLDVPVLNAFLARGPEAWRSLRDALQGLFDAATSPGERERVERALVPRATVTMALPFAVQDYVDFYSGINHANNVGQIFRPNGEALTPNYRHLPIGYHGRASSIVVDGTPVRRPHGQWKAPGDAAPSFGPSQQLDIELELGFVTGPGNRPGEPIPIARARDHVYGYVLLNDWSARDVQAWESQPLGPFLSKSFATSISPWLVSLDALEPMRVQNRALDPEPLPYLRATADAAYDIALEVLLQSDAMRRAKIAPAVVART
jgi:fumarylacetoacetase